MSRPKDSRQYGYRICATVAHKLNKEYDIPISKAAQAAAQWANKCFRGANGERYDVDEETVRQEVFRVRREEREAQFLHYKADISNDDVSKDVWIAVSPGTILNAAKELINPPKVVTAHHRALAESKANTRRAAIDRGIEPDATPDPIVEANERRRRALLKKAAKRSPAPFSKPRKEK